MKTLIFFFLSAVLFSCEPNNASQSQLHIADCDRRPFEFNLPQKNDRGELLGIELKKTFTIEQVQSAYHQFSAPQKAIYGVKYYSIIYRTVDVHSKPVVASGAIYLPMTKCTSLPMVAVQHGTIFKTEEAPSNAIGSPLVYAGQGYLTVAADYLGYGASEQLFHPYHHAQSLGSAVTDMMRAARQMAAKMKLPLNRQIYLTGYSEGGYATLAVQKYIETDHKLRDEFDLAAVAPVSGPYDLAPMAQKMVEKDHAVYPAYLPFVLLAYDEIYNFNRPMTDYFNEPYASQIKSWYNKQLSGYQINQKLPKKISKLFKPELLKRFKAGKEPQIIAALKENTLTGSFSPQAPLKFYHCENDETVPVENSYHAKDSFHNSPARPELVTMPGNHFFCPVYFSPLDWFNSKSHRKAE